MKITRLKFRHSFVLVEASPHSGRHSVTPSFLVALPRPTRLFTCFCPCRYGPFSYGCANRSVQDVLAVVLSGFSRRGSLPREASLRAPYSWCMRLHRM